LRKSKRNPVQLLEWRELLDKSFPPKNAAHLPQVVEALETAVERQLTDEEKQEAIAIINFVVHEYLRSEALEDAVLTDSEARARVGIIIGLMTKLLERLEKATAWELIMISGGNGREFKRFIGYLKRSIALNNELEADREKEHEARKKGLEANRKAPHFDAKVVFLARCRKIIGIFSGELPGLTSDGPLTKFATAAFKYGTEMKVKFGRQVRQISEYERFSEEFQAKTETQMKEKWNTTPSV